MVWLRENWGCDAGVLCGAFYRDVWLCDHVEGVESDSRRKRRAGDSWPLYLREAPTVFRTFHHHD